METQEKVWLITGVSGGLGRALAGEAAQQGNIVIGTLRKEQQLQEFNDLVPGKTFGTILDVTDHQQTEQVVNNLFERYGKIDVLVNNAGYGLFGAIEEVSMQEIREQMETNFFGAVGVTKAVLPHMRKNRSGHILQISSMAGMRSNPGMGIYNASKFALEGFSEALALETSPLNIKVTIVEPGPFRTNWAGASSSRSDKSISDYAETAGKLIHTVQGYSGQQPNDPEKGAKAIIKAINGENPPLRLPLGPEAISAIRIKLKSVEENINQVESYAAETGFS